VQDASQQAASGGSLWVRLWAWVGAVVLAMTVGLLVVNWMRPGVWSYPVRGIDVSHHQGEIDWQALAGAKLRFAFIKATEGRDHRDTRFALNWQEADRAGLVRGAYHFFTFCSPGLAQAEHFLKVVPPTAGALPPAIDVEFAGNCRSWTAIDDIRRELTVFLGRIEEAWGRRPLLYLTSESDERIVAGHFDGYPIWIRNVIWRPHPEKPPWLFWQFSDDGELPGIGTPVDMNVFHGSEEELTALAGR
jgi:lysozyme